VIYSSPWRGHLCPSLSLLLGISFFWDYWNYNCFWYSFLVCLLLVYRKANDFCKLILYLATLFKLFKMSKIFRWSFLGLWGIASFHLQIGIFWLLLYLFVFLLFLLIALLLCLGIQDLCWIRVERVGILVLFLQLEVMVSIFPH
jgi:hypothetical protein